jgi:hypothetical protein
MSQVLPPSLPLFDRNLLNAVERLVPSAEREEWFRTWQAELWHLHHRNRNRRIPSLAVVTDLSIGLTCDALWLRTDSWRRAFSGTAVLCLATLLGLSLVSTLIALVLKGNWHSLSPELREQAHRTLLAAPLVLFVAFATASRRHIEQGAGGRKLYWIKRQLFFVVKMSHVLVLAFLLSVDICQPVHVSFPNTADLLQIFCFVILSLVGLRWALQDQEQRCKQCLRSLATPARVGRPSHNLLEWNGTELNCKEGHGLLSVPEMETSWCRSSRWVEGMAE